jgi:hypothetical protein
LDGLARRQDTDILAVWTYHADFCDADGFIYSEFVGAYTLLLDNRNPARGWFLAGE